MSDATERAAALAELIDLAQPFAEPALGTQGIKQVEVAKVLGTIAAGGAGNATIIVTADGMPGSPKTVSVAVANNDTATQVAVKIRAALTADAQVSSFFDISGTGINIVLRVKVIEENDATMNISIADGTSSGLTAAPVSTTKQEGSVEDLTELEAVLDRNLRAKRWVAGTFFEVNTYVRPTASNGMIYRVVTPGVTGADEPTSWPTSNQTRRVTNGAVVFEEAGFEFRNAYDVRAAAYEAWNVKMAKASQFVSTPGVNMTTIYDNCKKMRDTFQSVLVA